MHDGITRIVRITNSRRLSDRFLTVQIKEPDEPELEKLGKIFAIVEIESPLKENRQIGQAIINTLSRNYFVEKVKDPIEQFEKAIKHVNKELYKITKNNDNDWLGKINAVLALVVNGEAHISSAGTAYAWLIRDGANSSILDNDDQNYSPEKTFSHIISGSLESKDMLLVASSGLMEIVSPSTLKGNVFGSEDLLTAAIRFSQILRAKKGLWVNGILLDFHHFGDASNLTRTKLPETIYLDSGSNFDLRILTASTLKVTEKSSKRVGGTLKSWSSGFKSFIQDSIVPANKKAMKNLKSFASNNGNKLKTGISSAGQKAQDLQKDIQTKASQKTIENTNIGNDISLIGKNLLSGSNLKGGKEGAKKIASGAASEAKNFGKKFIDGARSLPKQSFWKSSSFYIKLTVVLLLGLLIFNLGSIIVGDERQQANQQLVAEFEDLQNRLDEARLSISLGQQNLAIEFLENILEQAPKFYDTSLDNEAREITAKAEDLFDEIYGITRADLGEALFEIDDAKTLTSQANYLFGSSGDELTIYNTEDQQERRSGFVNNFFSATDYNNSFIAYDGTSVNIISDTLNISSASSPEDWASGTKIATFGSNAYILSPSENQIWRYGPSGANFAAPTAYVTDGADLTNAVDLAVDGSIYVLKSDGNVLEFFSGESSQLNLQVPAPLNNPTAIETKQNWQHIYILADNRLYIFSKTGVLIKALKFDSAVIDFAVSGDEQNLFILSNEKVYQVAL